MYASEVHLNLPLCCPCSVASVASVAQILSLSKAPLYFKDTKVMLSTGALGLPGLLSRSYLIQAWVYNLDFQVCGSFLNLYT